MLLVRTPRMPSLLEHKVQQSILISPSFDPNRGSSSITKIIMKIRSKKEEDKNEKKERKELPGMWGWTTGTCFLGFFGVLGSFFGFSFFSFFGVVAFLLLFCFGVVPSLTSAFSFSSSPPLVFLFLGVLFFKKGIRKRKGKGKGKEK